MRILDRYVFREVLAYGLLGLAIFTFVFFVPQLAQLMDIIVRNAADFATTVQLLAATLPGIFTFTIPIAVLVGVLIGLGRMASDSEVIAMHACGVSLRRILLPVGALAFLAGGLTLALTFWLAPASVRWFQSLEDKLQLSPAAVQIQPRVFEERFGDWIVYVEDVEPGGMRWRGILLAKTNGADESRLTIAEEAILTSDGRNRRFTLHLKNGSSHEYLQSEPERYSISTFAENSLTLETGGRLPRPPRRAGIAGLTSEELLAQAREGELEARIEFNRRLAFPVACLVFALLGVPVGVRPARGGRAAGFILTLGLIAAYYIVFVAGVGLARRELLPAALGVWGANVCTALLGLLLLPGMEEMGREGPVARLANLLSSSRRPRKLSGEKPRDEHAAATLLAQHDWGMFQAAPGVSAGRRAISFPLLLDVYVARQFFLYFGILIFGSLILLESFTFFELLEDIGKNRIPFSVVSRYFFFLTPHLGYQLTPLAASTATLVALAVMAKHNEIIAYKASGVSFYRMTLPLLIVGAVLAGGLFLLDSSVLPYTNQTQDALRNQIKGRRAQTFHQPRRQWIFGEQGRLYNYELFDPDRSLFGGLNVFELDLGRFELQRRIFARRAHWRAELGAWVLEEGWVREFHGGRVTDFRPFVVASLPELREPPEYFQREVRQYYQMNWRELRQYIRELQRAGFSITRFSVQWHRKFAFPLMAPVLILLAAPFALRVGNRGATAGLAAGVGVAIAFWTTAALFEAVGAAGQLPAWLAGWAPTIIFTFLGFHFYLKAPT